MAAGINGMPLNASGAVSVPISKYISNATHSGAAQQSGKEATQVQDSASIPVTPQAEEAQSLPGMRVSGREDGSQCFQTDSGLVMNTTAQGNILSIEIPGEGLIQPRDEGNFFLQTANGAEIPVQPYGSAENSFEGYTFQRQDGTKIHFNLTDMSLGYISPDNKIWQEISPTGAQVIQAKSSFRDPQSKQISDLLSQVTVTPNGQVFTQGYDQDLRIGANKIQFTNPANFKQTINLPTTIPALVTVPKPEPAQTSPEPAPYRPLMMEEPPAPPQAPINIPSKPVAHAVLPSQVGFDRDEQGQTAVMLRSGLTMIYTLADGAAVRDPKVADQLLPASVSNYTATDGRIEKQFDFTDSTGVHYRCFQESMDVLIDSADGKVRQHILPDGTILGQVQGPDGQFKRFEVTPRGQVKADPGLTIPPSSGDRGQAYLSGAGGQSLAINLAYPIPADQANAGMYADMYGTPKYPQSGQRLPAFATGSPPDQPNIPPGPPAATPIPTPVPTPAPNAGTEPMTGFNPNQGPMAGSSFSPGSGQVSPPMAPGWANPAPGYYGAPPPYMGGYPGDLYGYPGNPYTAYGNPYTPYGNPYSNPGSNPYPGPGNAPYPGQGGPQPGFTGQTPSYPGQAPDGPTLMERMKADFERTNQALWAQLGASQMNTQMMIAGQSMHSALSGWQMAMAMWPRHTWFCPFW